MSRQGGALPTAAPLAWWPFPDARCGSLPIKAQARADHVTQHKCARIMRIIIMWDNDARFGLYSRFDLSDNRGG